MARSLRCAAILVVLTITAGLCAGNATAKFMRPPAHLDQRPATVQVAFWTRARNHYSYVCHRSTWPVARRSHCVAWRWSRRRLARARALLAPPRPAIDSCTMQVIRNEGSGFDPADRSTWLPAATRPNSHGSDAYGVPQALPGSKMAGYGADWATNPWTQIRWMIDYETSRYGSPCAALAYWNLHYSY